MKELVASRVPPGDRWALIESESDIVYGSLTDCLNQIYKVHSTAQFEIDAREGTISIDDGVPIVEPIKTFDLYGEK